MKPSFVSVGAVLLLALAPFAHPAVAHETVAGDLTIDHAYGRPNLPNRPTAAYMKIVNAGDEGDRLISAASAAFGTIEIHTMEMEGDVMKMRPVEGVDIPAGGAAELAPGGVHLMLFDAAQQFKIGDSYPLTLTFENAGEVEITVNVEKVTGHGHGEHGHGEHGHGDHGHGDHDHGDHDHGDHSTHEHSTTN